MNSLCTGLSVALCACAALAQTPDSRVPASLAETLSSADDRGVSVPANGGDSCGAPALISGYGAWSFDLAGATTDGLGDILCSFASSDQIYRDRWWSWTASANGNVTIETCGLSTTDTRLAVYTPAATCPPASEYLVACDDDACAFQSSIEFFARAGQEYRIRLGKYGFPGEPAATGSGMFTISGPPQPEVCPEEVIACQLPVPDGDAHNSTSFFRVADDFRPDVAGDALGICWYGSYGGVAPATDAFTITYWSNDGGLPGVPLATYSQSDGTLAVQRADSGEVNIVGDTMFIYSASHAPFAFPGAARRWIEVRNFAGPTWYWQVSADGNGSWQDSTPASDWTNALEAPSMAFCVHYSTGVSGCAFDTNGDGVINFADLNNIVSTFNTDCP